MNAQTWLAILRIVLPVATQIVSMFHEKQAAQTVAQKTVDTAAQS